MKITVEEKLNCSYDPYTFARFYAGCYCGAEKT